MASICKQIGIPDINDVVVTKVAVKKAIWDHPQADVLKELSESKKLMDIKDEDFSTVQDYFKDNSVENTRMAFKLRSKMVADIPCNFKTEK